MQRGPIVLASVLVALLLIAAALYLWKPQENAQSRDLSIEEQAISFVQRDCERIGGDDATIQSCKITAARLVAEDFAGARECEKFSNKNNPECQPPEPPITTP